jgi:hypothetical protein
MAVTICMDELLAKLNPKERRGSKPRCHLLTNGHDDRIAFRLNSLVAPFASVSPGDRWMPEGFSVPEEAQLDRAPRLVSPEVSAELRKWWLGASTTPGRTPNFDIASTCTVGDELGLMLVEAKAHHQELIGAKAGRAPRHEAADDETERTIRAAIAEACHTLELKTGFAWGISTDSHYQLSNRVAWAWKLTTLGIPVVLIYLGFLEADEMADRGASFIDHAEWERSVRAHSTGCVPDAAWNRCWMLDGAQLCMSIRSLTQPLGPSRTSEATTELERRGW